jgi:hypothetical protein
MADFDPNAEKMVSTDVPAWEAIVCTVEAE